MATLGQFAGDVLIGLGAPLSQANLDSFANIADTEGINNYFNPLNIEWHPGQDASWQGYANQNNVGVQKYATYQDGVDATIAFLKANPHWAPFVSALQSGASQQTDENVLTAAYTWAKLKIASPVQDQVLLNKSLGNGAPINAALAAGPPPYDPSTLTAPLSAAQSAAMLQWIQAIAKTAAPSSSAWAALDDAGKIASYDGYAKVWGITNASITGPPSVVNPFDWSTELGKILGDLDNPTFWKWLGVGALGVVVVAGGSYLLLRSDDLAPSPKHIAEGAALV